MTDHVRHGDIWFADVPNGKVRPVLILTRDPVADRIGALVVAPITRTDCGLGSHFPVGPDEGLDERSVANLDATMLIRRGSLARRAGGLTSERARELCQAIRFAFGC